MKIEFNCNIKNCESLKDVACLINLEGIGWDEMGKAHVVIPSESDEIQWITCWSGFSYVITFNEFSERKFNVEFRGALKSFLKQNLLPNFIDVVVRGMSGKLGTVPILQGKEKLVYDKFHVSAVEKLRGYIEALLPKTAADSLMELETKQLGKELLDQAGLVFTDIHGWCWWSTSISTTIYRGYTTKEFAEEFKKIQEKEINNNSLSVEQNRANYQEVLWNWIEK